MRAKDVKLKLEKISDRNEKVGGHDDHYGYLPAQQLLSGTAGTSRDD